MGGKWSEGRDTIRELGGGWSIERCESSPVASAELGVSEGDELMGSADIRRWYQRSLLP